MRQPPPTRDTSIILDHSFGHSKCSVGNILEKTHSPHLSTHFWSNMAHTSLGSISLLVGPKRAPRWGWRGLFRLFRRLTRARSAQQSSSHDHEADSAISVGMFLRLVSTQACTIPSLPSINAHRLSITKNVFMHGFSLGKPCKCTVFWPQCIK